LCRLLGANVKITDERASKRTTMDHKKHDVGQLDVSGVCLLSMVVADMSKIFTCSFIVTCMQQQQRVKVKLTRFRW
jgi:hypothetical protein